MFQKSERRKEDTFQRRERRYVQIKVIGVERSNDRVKKKYIAVLNKGCWTQITEKDVFQTEKNVFQAEKAKDVLPTEKDVLQAEKDVFQAEKDVFQTEKDVFQAEKDVFQTQKDVFQAEKKVNEKDDRTKGVGGHFE